MYYEINEDLPIENFIKNKNLDVGFIDINGEILNLSLWKQQQMKH